jgi:quercetin dioxygenase-like cupin family protein
MRLLRQPGKDGHPIFPESRTHKYQQGKTPLHAAVSHRGMRRRSALMASGEDLSSRVIDLSGMISCQPGAIVSKMLVYKKSGTITLFAFDSGEGLSEHTAPYDAILMVLEGEAEVTIAGTTFSIIQGQLIIMPADIPHAVHARTPFKMLLTMIHS